jgi:hypothetical protein
MVGDSFERGDLAFPESLPGFQKLFPNDAACAAYLEASAALGNRLFTAHFVLTEANAAGAAHDKGSWNSPTRTLCVKWRRYNEQR